MGKVLHASYSGWFPFCVRQIDSIYPFPPASYSPASLETVMKIWWRIKKIRFYGTYTQTNLETPVDVPWEFVAQRNAGAEESLVCDPSPAWQTISLLNLQSAEFRFEADTVAYKDIQENQFVLNAFISGILIDVLQEEEISLASIWFDPGERTFDFEGITFTNSPPEFIFEGTINYEVLEYWSYDGTYDTSTGQPL